MENTQLAVRNADKIAQIHRVYDHLTALAKTGGSLGVSRGYLFRNIEDLGLTETDVQDVIDLRSKHQLSVAHVFKMMHRGCTLEDIGTLYDVRDEIKGASADEEVLSIQLIKRITDVFPSCTLDDDLSETILDAHQKVASICPGVNYVSESVSLLCRIGKAFELTGIETAIEYVERINLRNLDPNDEE